MTRTDDQKLWLQLFLDTPLSAPDERVAAAQVADDLLDCPGTCLKSRDRDGRMGFPKYHGKLAVYDEAADRAVVIGHNTPVSPPDVWEGTVAEYRATWTVD